MVTTLKNCNNSWHAVSVLNDIKCRNGLAKRRLMTANLPNINCHRTDIEMFEAIACYV